MALTLTLTLPLTLPLTPGCEQADHYKLNVRVTLTQTLPLHLHLTLTPGCEQPDHYKLTASSLSLTIKQKQIGCCQDKVRAYLVLPLPWITLYYLVLPCITLYYEVSSSYIS